MSIIGYPLGILIGIITGVVFKLYFDKVTAPNVSLKTVITISTQLLALPFVWVGGSWTTTQMFKSVNFEQIIPGYIVSLAITWVLIVSWTLIPWVAQEGNRAGKAKRRQK